MNQHLTNYPFWFVCSIFCMGVLTSSSVEQLLFLIAPVISVFIILCVISLCLFFKKITDNYFLLITSVVFFFLGFLRFQITLPKYLSNHIINITNLEHSQKITFNITEILKDSEKNQNFKVKITSVNHILSKGFALLSISKKNNKIYTIGDSYITYSKLKPLKISRNPYAFEYSNYLKTQHITHKLWHPSLFKIKTSPHTWFHLLHKTRSHIIESLKNQNLHPSVRQITEALVLGNKTSLDEALKTKFVNAGVIHILAISGLHIGIIYLLLNGIFNAVNIKPKYPILTTIAVIILLWLFTWFSGSSSSALRATTMFTCFQFSKLSSRPQHPINALFLSIFILINFDPYIILSIGFQLSIFAVASIIIGVPLLFRFWYPKNKIALKLWGIICVSFCAQIGILPSSIYYFHQFSTLFLIANIPIVLIITIILCLAIIIVFLSALFRIPNSIAYVYNELILAVIKYIEWVANFNSFILKGLYINTFTFLFCYLFIFYLGYLYINPRRGYKLSLPILILGMCILFFEYNHRLLKNELWLLNNYSNTIFIELTSNKIDIHSNHKLSDENLNYIINPIIGNIHYKRVTNLILFNRYRFLSQNIHVINSKKQVSKNYQNDIIILNNSPKINLDRLLKDQQPKMVISTTRNYTNLVKKWKATCLKKQVAFYAVSENGSLNLTDLINLLKK